MVTKEEAKTAVKQLVDAFSSKSEHELKEMNEATVNKNFILPLFHVLGWDVYSDEVSAEEKVSKKRVDFGFKINGITKFFLEAKKPSEDVLGDIDHIRQAINYSYWQSVTWAILTNFRDLVVFNAEWKGRNLSENRFITLNFKEFIDKFDELWLVGRESLEKNIIDEKAVTLGKKQKREPIGDQILSDMITWRELLTKNINKYDHKLDEETLEEAVQRILDRLIFIKSCEDRGIESITLLAKTRQWEENWMHAKRTLREELIHIFRDFDTKYNSKLFEPHICESLKIDDDILHKIVMELNGDEAGLVKYDFSAIPADILGNIYEQYLGHILKKSQKTTKIVEKHAHRKEQGIYYTPTYIVDYIVQNTVGESIKNKSIDEILETKILDPACGSGSFLIKAYTTLLKIIEDKLKKGETTNHWQSFKSYSGRLTLNQKISILTSCIFGVDLDTKAVEIAQLNLLLKLLEGETGETLANIKEIKKLLPMLNNNITCGNSLIDDPAVAGDKAFKWGEEFPEIMKRGGFDVVIGNPPYFDIRINQDLQIFCKYRYPEIYTGQNDVLYYFVMVGLKLLKENGSLGFIVSRYFLESDSAKKFRGFILENSEIKQIIDFGNNQVFDGVNVLTSIIILNKNIQKKKNSIEIIKLPDKTDTRIIKNSDKIKSEIEIIKINQEELSSDIWTFYNKKSGKLLEKIKKDSFFLGDIARTGAGIQSGLNDVYVVGDNTISKYGLEKSLLRNYVKTRDLKPFFIINRGLKVIRLISEDSIERYPNTLAYLTQNMKALKNRYEAKKGICKWFAFAVPRNLEIFDSSKEKIITPIYSTSNKFGYDSGKTNEKFMTLSDTAIIQLKDNKYSTKTLVAILNSRLMNFYYKKTRKLKREGYFEYLSKTLESLPIKYSKTFEEKIIPLVNKIIDLNKRLYEIGDKKTDERASIEEKIKKTYDEINKLVYDLYDITKEDQIIIEENLK